MNQVAYFKFPWADDDYNLLILICFPETQSLAFRTHKQIEDSFYCHQYVIDSKQCQSTYFQAY